MTDNELILKKLERIERMVTDLRKEEKKIQWVKASLIIQLTGWDRNRMERARKNGDIEYKRQNKSIWYNLNSLPKIFYKPVNSLS